jgi:NAD(P)-dependent dehydrogenase (short-subunit alcohol dehydrogenase family)
MKRNIVISGASSGIGLAIAQRFIQSGDCVFNLDIKPPIDATIEKLDTYVSNTYVECDLRDHDQVVKAIGMIESRHPINVLISNAGMHYSANIENTSEEDFMSVFNLNVKGAYSMTQAALSGMRVRKKGVILFIGSDQSLVGKPSSFAYNLTKHCLSSMAKTTALDYANYNIRANVLCPGTVDTPLYQKAISAYCAKNTDAVNIDEVHKEEALMQPLGRIGKPEDVAALAFFLASDEASFITGSAYSVDGGYTAK